jgi:hypothetical protein
LLVTLALTVAPFAPREAEAALDIPAQAVFDNWPGIRGDGRGPYVNGVDGVKCVFFNPADGGTGDFRLDLSWRNSRNPRTLYYNFSNTITLPGCPATGVVPSSGYRRSGMTVGGLTRGQSLYQMAPGSQRVAWAWTHPDGPLWFGAPSGWNSYCSTHVLVTRTSATQWVIEAVPSILFPPTGATAVLTPDRRETTPRNYFTMPFRITVTLI